MSARELLVLGTASQVPTRQRNHNGYLLRWDGEGILFDPGEGTQRQLTLAGQRSSSITRICITHFHGDHCLGLPGVIQRLALDGVNHPIDVYFPASGRPFFDRLRSASIFLDAVDVRPHPLPLCSGVVAKWPGLALVARPLDHGLDTLGWRLEEPDGRRMLPERLESLGLRGPDVGRLQREGAIELAGGLIGLDQVSELRRGQSFAFVMDTRACEAALALAEDADLLVCESTFGSGDESLAQASGHLTAPQAGALAAAARARRLALTHFSQRYPDESVLGAQAAEVFPEVVVARDLEVIPVPKRS